MKLGTVCKKRIAISPMETVLPSSIGWGTEATPHGAGRRKSPWRHRELFRIPHDLAQDHPGQPRGFSPKY